MALFQLYPLGDSAIVVAFGKEIESDLHTKIQAFSAYLQFKPFEGMIEYVPAFTTVTVYFNPWIVSEKGKYDPYARTIGILQDILALTDDSKEKLNPKRVEIPVCYGGTYGPDLEYVAQFSRMSTEEVIARHTSVEYLVYMIGFAPGFPYLGGMDARIAAPRKDTPRTAVPKGSVGIAGLQTGIYPLETPGGWQLIGRTPLSLFYPRENAPSLLQAGDLVRFAAISEQEFNERKEQERGA